MIYKTILDPESCDKYSISFDISNYPLNLMKAIKTYLNRDLISVTILMSMNKIIIRVIFRQDRVPIQWVSLITARRV